MTEQGSEAVNPGQAIYDGLSDEAKAAVDALPEAMLSNDKGRNRLSRFAASTNRAASLGPSSWAIQSGSNVARDSYLTLNVGNVNLLKMGTSDEFTVNRSVLVDSNLLSLIRPTMLARGTMNDDRLVLDWNLVSSDLEQRLVAAHEQEIAIEANPTWIRPGKPRKNQGWKWHRDDWRVKLAMITGTDLPAPSYVPDDRIGLPMDSAEAEPMLQSVGTSVTIRVSDTSAVGTTSSNYMPQVLSEGFAFAGLTYTDSQVASFYTALQTKGFVILSGISGTGKSKIAQRFADMLPAIEGQPEAELAADYVRIAVKPYMKKYKRIRLLNEVSASLSVPAPGTSILVPFSLDGEQGKCRVWTRPEANAGTYLFPQGEIGEDFRDRIEDSFAVRFHTDHEESRIESIDLLTELPLEKSRPSEASISPNHLFLPVRPDWRDGKALIGYHNPLTGEYVRTGFLDFVIAAGDDYRDGNRNAFFIILDEMNLAHVEYYFADVLSVIESGRHPDGHMVDGHDMGCWTVEGIPLAVDEEASDLPERLRLPPNLYIVGTVNMDETTHPFSPKVLDRAFTIELTDVDFRDYPPEAVEGGGDLSDAERRALLDAFTGGGEHYPRIDKADIRAVVERHGRFRTDLENLNTSLKRYRMHFGYRVFDEIMQFVHNAERNGLFASADEAFDHAVLMKVLPKFNGSLAKLERALLELIGWSRQAIDATSDDTRAISDKFAGYVEKGTSFDTLVRDADDWRYPATGRRAALMMQDLYTDGFASFG